MSINEHAMILVYVTIFLTITSILAYFCFIHISSDNNQLIENLTIEQEFKLIQSQIVNDININFKETSIYKRNEKNLFQLYVKNQPIMIYPLNFGDNHFGNNIGSYFEVTFLMKSIYTYLNFVVNR